MQDGLTSDEMLVLGLEKDSEKLPFFSGCHVYPIFPGEGARYGSLSLQFEHAEEHSCFKPSSCHSSGVAVVSHVHNARRLATRMRCNVHAVPKAIPGAVMINAKCL